MLHPPPLAPALAAAELQGSHPAPPPNPAMWRYPLSFLVLLAFLYAGDALAHAARLPLPGSVLGMLLLAGSLRRGWIAPALVRPAAQLLIRHMALLFVPAGVGLMTYFGLLGREWVPIVAASIVSTVAVMAVVGWMQQRLEPDA